MESSHIPRGQPYFCAICERSLGDRTELIEHLRVEHELLEVASYAAATMAGDQERDRTALDYHRRFELLKKELSGHDE